MSFSAAPSWGAWCERGNALPIVVLSVRSDEPGKVAALDALSKREFELLRLLVEHAGKVMTHRQILTAVWGEAHRDDVEYLRVYVRQLRSKLGDDPAARASSKPNRAWGTG